MIKLSTKGRYALRAIVDLAVISSNSKQNISLKDIAARQNISIKYLEALFSVLKSAGILKSHRGSRGGYILAKSPKKISAEEVIAAIEGPISFVDCCVSKSFCDNTKTCKTIGLWKDVNNLIVDKLKNTTIQDLI